MDNRSYRYMLQDRIRGKVAEMLFEEMFKSAGYVVMFNGYERNLEFLVQARGVFKCDPKIKVFGSSPDFLLVGAKNYYFVEVKFRSRLDARHILELATSLRELYPKSRLFLVHHKAPYFYYNSVERIVENSGGIDPLKPAEVGICPTKYMATQLALKKFLGE